MNRLLIRLQKKNRTLLEMRFGMIGFGLLCQLIGMICLAVGSAVGSADGAGKIPGWEDTMIFTFSLWSGVAGAMLSAWHMNRTLERALDCGESAAQKMIFAGFLFRYVLIVVIMLIIIVSGILNPLVTFLGYMGLKAAALLQPFTHKLCNRIFHEADPEPVMEEEL